MLGKIVQILGVPMEDGFRVEEGINFCKYGTADVHFATLILGNNPLKNDYKVTHCWEFTVEKEDDGFKEILVNNLIEPEEKDIEERLLVIIPHFTEFKTSCKKIAGRYPEEGIIEMKVGDTVTVNKIGAKPETYMAVQAGNEMFLVKKNR